MVDLKKKPFYLSDEDIAWVENTIAGMSEDEKLGQLFINLGTSREEAYLRKLTEVYHVGGIRYTNADAQTVYRQNQFLQQNSRIPLLIASNCEQGGKGGCSTGTYVASAAQAGASCNPEKTAYDLGYVSGVEAQAIGCNWNFAPVADIFFNWRNTIVNTRSFSNDPDKVLSHCRSFIRGLRKSNVAECAKHFPGDGTEERDQHLLMGVNELSCEAWDASYGKVYQGLINDGLLSIMVGHICQPAYARKFSPEIRDEDILPATLSRELLTDLLRGQLGFNGLILTDASHMVGFWSHLPRSKQIPQAIAAGCDMILFFNDPEEDLGYLREGIRCGMVSQERLHDALARVLGLKAALGLHRLQQQGCLVGAEDALQKVGCKEHLSIAAQAADDTITLVKDTHHLLPITPATHPRLRLYYLPGDMGGLMDADDEAKQVLVEELERVGFSVTLNDGSTNLKGSMAAYHASCDAALVVADITGYARENTRRIAWKTAQSSDVPWYTCEVPTVFVSLNFTTHLHDVPMCRTFINAYGNTRTIIRATLQKIMGNSPFKGHCNDTVWCGKWDTHL